MRASRGRSVAIKPDHAVTLLSRALLVLAIIPLLAACASPLARFQANSQKIIVGQDTLAAQLAPLSGAPALPATKAVSLAERYVTTWPQATRISTRYVALTLRSTQGKVAWGVDQRPVWLVEFTGARYAPPAYPESDCACDRTFQPPNTDVAVDAQTGALVMDYGTGG